MKKLLEKLDPWYLFRIVVVPAFFLGAMIRHPVAQWCAAGILIMWVVLQIAQVILKHHKAKPSKKQEPHSDETITAGEDPVSSTSEETVSKSELFLVRQINHRITEQLKQAYPSVSWIWKHRPTVEEFQAGGTWRIQISQAEPYNLGEVCIQENGAMSITLMLAQPLKTVEKAAETKNEADLEPKDELDRTDAQTWYSEYGSSLLTAMIDDLNTQGHKKLTIHDDGEVFIAAGEKEIAVDKLAWFLPRMAWPEFCTLLKEDGITAKEETAGLVLTW